MLQTHPHDSRHLAQITAQIEARILTGLGQCKPMHDIAAEIALLLRTPEGQHTAA